MPNLKSNWPFFRHLNYLNCDKEKSVLSYKVYIDQVLKLTSMKNDFFFFGGGSKITYKYTHIKP